MRTEQNEARLYQQDQAQLKASVSCYYSVHGSSSVSDVV